jgi:hypothetical protein
LRAGRATCAKELGGQVGEDRCPVQGRSEERVTAEVGKLGLVGCEKGGGGLLDGDTMAQMLD